MFLFRSVTSFKGWKMTPFRIPDLCKGMENTWNAGKDLSCLDVFKTKQKTKPPNPNNALWVCGTQRTMVLTSLNGGREGNKWKCVLTGSFRLARREHGCEKSGAWSGQALSLRQYKVMVGKPRKMGQEPNHP